MLAGVLLHMIKPPQPIDTSFYNSTHFRCTSLYDMQDPVCFVIDAFNYTHPIQHSGIAWLTAAGRIEGRSVKGNRGPAADPFGLIDDTRFELNEMGIVVIESFGCHGRGFGTG